MSDRTVHHEHPSSTRVVQPGRLLLIAMVATVAAVAAVIVRPVEDAEPQNFDERITAAVSDLSRSPAEPDAYLTLAELGLDSGAEDRVILWERSAATAQRLAPSTDLPERAIVRGGFLHWYELNEEQRELVLTAAAELLANEDDYRQLWQPVLQATRDPGFLARHAPREPITTRQIRDLAAIWGDAGTYLILQRQVPQMVAAAIPSMEDREVVDLLLRLPVTLAHREEASILLEALEDATLDEHLMSRVSQARERWASLMGGELSQLELPVETQIPGSSVWRLEDDAPRALMIEVERLDELQTPVIVEVWVDGRLREARVSSTAMTFDVRLAPRDEIMEIRLAASRTRNNEPLRALVRIDAEER